MSAQRPIALVLHGGAGTQRPEDFGPDEREGSRAGLAAALAAGEAVLTRGGPALEAVAAAIVVLEDSPWFNAGRGAVFNADGGHDLDAAIMEGHTLRAGAVAGLTTVKNPVLLARDVLGHSGHVFLAGAGAEKFADTRPDITRVAPDYFSTPGRRAQLEAARAHEAVHGVGAYFGTVGAVALDRDGHLAAATSTGGLSNKRYGRIGDSPLIGAGTYANARVGVSCTGSGEFYIRAAVAHDLCARVEYRGDDLDQAARDLIERVIPSLGGEGGLIALDANGNLTMPFNTSTMHRAWLRPDGSRGVATFAGEG
ncbi:MAG TPA: isoaspartyl peptidase/L-asparaginase [Polyangiaceae bacterium]|nr:isoaspartyl peptidase/L-asparaginase [Polyangiaceae bacterium]